MQNAKDTFYEVLRGRLAALNPERTVVVRGISRPGVLVTENELVTANATADCFLLRWTEASADSGGALPLVTLGCEIHYETAGTALNAGMDRGRALAGMDAELLTAVTQCPQNAEKQNFSAVEDGGASTMATRVWWGGPEFGSSKVAGDRLGRTVSVAVMSYAEAGEL